MRNFLQKISATFSAGEKSFDHIVHLGAGQHAERSDYEGIRHHKLLLVEGDPEVAEKMSAAYVGDPSVQVISKLVSPAGGEVVFHRYNLAAVNGILPAGNLSTLYPRLRLLAEEFLPSYPFPRVIAELEIPAESKNLLILDLPGEDADLIQALSRDLLRKFPFIVIRGCLEAHQEGAKELGQTLSLLGKSHYKLVEQDGAGDSPWPIALLEFDGAVAEIEGELENRARLLVEKATQIHQQEERIVELEKALGEVTAHRDGMQREIAQVVQERDALQGAQASLNEELENRARLLVEKATQIHQQGERIVEAERHFGEVSAHRDALQGEVSALRDQLENANALQTSLQTQVSDLSAVVASKETLLDVLSKGRVQQDRMYEKLTEERDGLLKHIENLENQQKKLEQQIQERDGKAQLVDAEFQKVEGQMEIIKDIFLRERLK